MRRPELDEAQRRCVCRRGCDFKVHSEELHFVRCMERQWLASGWDVRNDALHGVAVGLLVLGASSVRTEGLLLAQARIHFGASRRTFPAGGLCLTSSLKRALH